MNKSHCTASLAAFFCCGLLFSQAPAAFSYQAVARSVVTGDPLVSFTMSARFHLHQGTLAGAVAYSEQQSVITNDQGLFALEVGSGTPLTGEFSTVNWLNGPYFLEVSLDLDNSGSYTSMGTQQLLSVPYALYAQTSGDKALLDQLRTMQYLSDGF